MKDMIDKDYIKVTEDSGCFSANFQFNLPTTKQIVISYNDEEISGKFKREKIRESPTNF